MRTLFAIFVALNLLLVFLLMIHFGVFAPRVALHIAAAPQHRAVAPLITEWAEDNKADIRITWLSPPEISQALTKGPETEFDAVWPDSSLWIALGDSDEVVQHQASVYRSPVILGLRMSTVIGQGWIGRSDFTLSEIAEAAKEDKFRLTMPAPTQSGAGAMAYLSLLRAFSEDPEPLTPEHLTRAKTLDETRALLAQMDRAPASDAALAEALVANYSAYDGLFTTEAQVIQTSQRLAAQGDEPLYALYPSGGMSVTDSPLGFIPKGDEAREAKFLDLQAFLASDEMQEHLVALGYRAGPDGPDAETVDVTVWNPTWGLDAAARFAATAPPPSPVIQEALRLYQTELRKPALTVWVMDVSNAMDGTPMQALKASADALFDPPAAHETLPQPDSRDVTILLPFNHNIRDPIIIEGGNPTATDRARRLIAALDADGGTDVYYALYEAFEALRPYVQDGTLTDYRPAIIVLTAGPSDSENRIPLLAHIAETPYTKDIPIHTIALGAADQDQLSELGKLSSGQVFRAGDDLSRTLQMAKGGN
ncbi:substrate-binding domain-containing protein [Antarctobacter jejuensis]|uniref:substrate-binding domain-containing protein n=1 Tax=Antarctobacter jejuensis TaxID=1439938 RepID=UPI003FD294C3